MYPLPAHMPVPVQHEYDNQQACQDLAGWCVLSLGGLPDTPPTWIWDLQMKGAHSRGWVSFQLRVAVGMHVESFKWDNKRTVPAAADCYLPSWYPEILQEHPILRYWVWILEFRKVLVIVFKKSIDGLYWHADQFEVNKGISTRADIQCIGQ